MMTKFKRFSTGVVLFLVLQACNMPGAATETEPAPALTEEPTQELATDVPPVIQHTTIPISAPDTKPYPDVTSADTAPEQRAPYGDSYDINRLERPFSQDMTYNADLDISTFSISEDGDFYYISIKLIGTNPNNSANIKYSVELDTDRDSFGNFLVVAEPPYSEEWTAENVKIFADTNHNSAGLSASKSDAPFMGDGYDALVFDIISGVDDDDVDVAWVRINAGAYSTVQFAVKKSFVGEKFLYSVMADAGLQDVKRLDYVDFFTEAEAGSPIRSSMYYPLKELFGVDNTCYQPFGFTPTGYEPKLCPPIVQPENVKEPGNPPPGTPNIDACTAIGRPNPGNCSYGWWDFPYCQCGIG